MDAGEGLSEDKQKLICNRLGLVAMGPWVMATNDGLRKHPHLLWTARILVRARLQVKEDVRRWLCPVGKGWESDAVRRSDLIIRAMMKISGSTTSRKTGWE